ncbi:Poly(A) RNA polymerase protein cid1 [Podospora fimiseda]|uniref:polynucleotide adenylyltransferase n=1 Tax=Podospora fimiseda TaxID=252190 RepID=A0AAN7H3N5_9PEZI|nr:Poly(A) RNA polymerase protein cid1 [Podospora fimiseda]
MAYSQPGEAPLEDRLRGLIVSNSTPARDAVPTGSSFPMQAQLGISVNDGQSAQAEDNSASSKGPRKRLNQAQRRQMSAQLSIPIDTRPQPPQSNRPYGTPQGYHHQQHSRGGGHFRGQQRPQSANFRPQSQGNGIPAGPAAGGHYRSQPRHHQLSQSYHGPVPTAENLEWRQSPTNNWERPGPNTSFDGHSPRYPPRQTAHGLYNPIQYQLKPSDIKAQTDVLDALCHAIIANAEIEPADILEKENFRTMIEQVAREAITKYEVLQNGFHDFPPGSVQLRCFGSLSSGFATKAADMDLGLLSPLSTIQPDAPGSPIPRLVEKAFLDLGLGARLLSRTRVPIIKVCERPPENLRLDLLEERSKWEKGVVEEAEEEDHHDNVDPAAADDSHTHGEDVDVEQRLKLLKQGDKTLSRYYAAAKTVLRKAGGRDLTNSNYSDFKKDDFILLNKVCLAFVEGLSDAKLRNRLLSYKSLFPYDLIEKGSRRTLFGVLTQVEGEVMAQLWEERVIREREDGREKQAEAWIRAWNDIQNRDNYNSDPLAYQKDLQYSADQLKKIPSVQILHLMQLPQETPAQYHSRTARLLSDLGGNDRVSRDDPLASAVIRYYIQGIRGDEIKKAVEEFAASQDNTLCLLAVARRHKSLQLAHDYEKCLEKEVYPEQSVAAVRRYIELLKGPMMAVSTGPQGFDFVVPATDDYLSMLAEIRVLGDPAKMGPNQPRDPYRDRLEFPKSGVGVQCDINFSAHLALQNTLLLRCYSHSDPRVRPLVLFVKHWAKVRQINSPYRGTLSSYGYVLMMLHYLVNIAQPFVCPNLQELSLPRKGNETPAQIEETISCKGRNIQFWRDEAEIQRLAQENALNQNRDSIGYLLRGFFEYYANTNMLTQSPCRGFDWGRDVISLRTHGGLLSKQQKGWTGAKTVIEVKQADVSPASAGLPQTPGVAATTGDQTSPDGQPGTPGIPSTTPTSAQAPVREFKEVRYRYLFAIEDPFELDHNVARTVTHNGIVAIRDEFRRAWKIITKAHRVLPQQYQEDLLEDASVAEERRERETFARLLEELHGLKGGSNGQQ